MIWLIPFLLWAPGLFEQSVLRVLQRDFPYAQFVLVDVQRKEVIGRQWVDADRPIPMGSLVKPFVAKNAGVLRCNPNECWRPQGHGEVSLVKAIAESCNSYFLQSAVPPRYGLPRPSSSDPATLIGVGSGWPIAPDAMALAYASLAENPAAVEIRKGMRLSARSGTAKALRIDSLAKTGTAPCSHTRKAPGDGYVAILYPPQTPKYVLLVQEHGVSGAVAARRAGEMLAVIRDGR